MSRNGKKRQHCDASTKFDANQHIYVIDAIKPGSSPNYNNCKVFNLLLLTSSIWGPKPTMCEFISQYHQTSLPCSDGWKSPKTVRDCGFYSSRHYSSRNKKCICQLRITYHNKCSCCQLNQWMSATVIVCIGQQLEQTWFRPTETLHDHLKLICWQGVSNLIPTCIFSLHSSTCPCIFHAFNGFSQ